ncbi:hypothetical protein ACFZDK_22200 [Streptomyces sp. NPDC007901]|uniref:hypothetical protein n=1 Tax=Streptomyces sp. NPDC007901 TaxID=3364785 RepID=UPI0036E3EF9F
MRDEAIHVQQVGKAGAWAAILSWSLPNWSLLSSAAPIAAPAVISGKRATNW